MSALRREIAALIAAEGPIGIDRYMGLALGHPVHGYYVTRDPFGTGGDFTTAPEISQMFGELLGLWAGLVWTDMGRPDPVALVELGPGRGTLMRDALRAADRVSGFLQAVSVHLVETSPVLRDVQARTLAGVDVPVAFHAALSGVPPGPAIVLANEFLDALPIRQFVRRDGAWHERLVGLGPDARLAFGLAPHPEPSLGCRDGRDGDIVEIGAPAQAVVADLSARLAAQGGAALLIDYGHVESGPGDTLQAVKGHAFADPLADPGAADLTAHVDFAALGRAAAVRGTLLHGPLDQGTFLRALGIRERAARLAALPGRDAEISAALERLTGAGRDAMGALFKVLALSHPDLAQLPGLPPARAERLPTDSEKAAAC